jgi:D-alanyl-D-alanine carboxypeptidase (penicillin-binding protein 5/6)
MRLIAGLLSAAPLLFAGTLAFAEDAAEPIGGEQLTTIGSPVVSPDAAELPDVDAASWLVADVDSGDVLAARNAHVPLPPASTIKLLTGLALLTELDPELRYEATEPDASVEGSRVGLVPEETYSKSDLGHGLMLASGNDAAHALAEIAGGQDVGVAAMNAEATRLGAFNTSARTPHGLDEPGQVSTAYDLALIGRAAMTDDDLAELMRTTTYDFPGLDGETFQIQNQNRLLGRYDGAVGLKTGYTSGAGHTLAAVAIRDEVSLIVTVFNPTDGRAEPIAEELLDWAFDAIATGTAPVGTLVTPEDVAEMVAAAPDPAAEVNDEREEASTFGPAPPSSSDVPPWAIPSSGALVVLLALMLVVRRRRQPRPTGRYAA